jgi:cytoskeletal protein RodZ
MPARTKPAPQELILESEDSLSEEPQTQEQDPALQNLESSQIFKEIGAELHKRRELLSLHLGEVEKSTHVKAHYLEALENGAVDKLPSTVQTRGMLSNYATFLDLDVDAILLRYADALQARHREKNPQKPVRKPGEPIAANIPSIRNFIAGDMIFGVGMAVLLIGFCIWGINRVMMTQSLREVQPTAPSISDMLLASPDPSLITPTATLAQIEAIVEATETILIPTQNLNVNVQVNLVAVERTFMRVVVDGKEVFNGRVVPGTAYPFEGENQIEVLVGSGAAIRIVYNGHDLGLLGGLGQVVNNIYRENDIITPTIQPTPTVPTATKTPPVTATELPTLTTVPTNTNTPAP